MSLRITLGATRVAPGANFRAANLPSHSNTALGNQHKPLVSR